MQNLKPNPNQAISIVTYSTLEGQVSFNGLN